MARADHPRSRGKTSRDRRKAGRTAGPPPLAREDRTFPTPDPVNRRTTPARAGRPACRRSSPRAAADHPRSRGKTWSGTVACSSSSGPPPLAREDLVHARIRSANTGPPPLAREDRRQRPPERLQCRTTPARAGRPGAGAAAPRTSPDHPRSRGKTLVRGVQVRLDAGPPPLAREDQLPVEDSARGSRTTPARAGRPRYSTVPSVRAADHPRSRGKTDSRSQVQNPLIGPPPLAREDRENRAGHGLVGRTTPARAGRPCPARASARRSSDHPRSRGKT